MMSSSLALFFALNPTARAAACCIGSTSTVPTRLGECEGAAFGVGVAAQQLAGAWDREGDTVGTSLEETMLTAAFAGSQRIDRRLQVSVTAPMVANHKRAGGDVAWGGGLGDLSAGLLWDPLEERFDPEKLSAPVPIFTLGARMPTGRSWAQSEDTLMADVTGQGRTAIIGGLQLERTLDRWPWSMAVHSELGAGADDAVASSTTYAVAGGRYVGTNWSVVALAQHQRSRANVSDVTTGSSNTELGLRAVRGQQRYWRAWAGVGLGVPLQGFGESMPRTQTLSAGFVRLWS